MIVCLLALVAGCLLAVCVPVMQLVVGLLVTMTAGASVAAFCGVPFARIALWTTGLYICAQVGYGLGLSAIAVLKARRSSAARGAAIHPVRGEPSYK